MPEKIAIFGGAFDPFHMGHLIIISNLLNSFEPKINRVVLLPSGKRRDKSNYYFSDNERLQFVEAIANLYSDGRVVVDSIELENSYEGTYSVMQELSKRYEEDLYFTIGCDLVKHLPNWRNADELREKVKFLVISRIGYKLPALSKYKLFRLEAQATSSISSTLIRSLISSKGVLHGLVPSPILTLIERSCRK